MQIFAIIVFLQTATFQLVIIISAKTWKSLVLMNYEHSTWTSDRTSATFTTALYDNPESALVNNILGTSGFDMPATIGNKSKSVLHSFEVGSYCNMHLFYMKLIFAYFVVSLRVRIHIPAKFCLPH